MRTRWLVLLLSALLAAPPAAQATRMPVVRKYQHQREVACQLFRAYGYVPRMCRSL